MISTKRLLTAPVNPGRRSFVKTLFAAAAWAVNATTVRVGLGAGVGSLAVFMASCGEQVLSWLATIIRTVGDLGPLFDELGLPKGVEIAAKIAVIAKKIDGAIRGKDFKNALDFLNEIIKPNGLFDELLALAGIAKSKIISGGVVILKFALGIVANFVQKGLETPQGKMMVAAASAEDAEKIANVATWANFDADRVLGLIKP